MFKHNKIYIANKRSKSIFDAIKNKNVEKRIDRKKIGVYMLSDVECDKVNLGETGL